MPETKIIMKNEDGIKLVYSNYVSVTSNPMECVLTFGIIDPQKLPQSNLEAHVVSRLVLPIKVAKSLVEAMTTNINSMESRADGKEKI